MSNGDLIPGSDAKFNDWSRLLNQVTLERTSEPNPVWTHVPKAAVDRLTNGFGNWSLAYGKTLKPHTPQDTLEKNRARDVLEQIERSFVNEYIRNSSLVSEADKESLGLRKAKPSPVPQPTAEPEADLVFPGLHLVELTRIRKMDGRPDDPRSDYGVRVYYGIVDAANPDWRIAAPPSKGSELPHSVFTRRKKMLFNFEGESGKTIYFCLCYERASGGKEGAGPFGPILHAVIP
jgi:hypothetical protein